MQTPGWTVADIPDQTGRLALVTGGTSGLGLETAVALAGRGASVVLTARDPARGAAALDTVRARVPGADVRVGELDLSRLESVRRLAAGIDRLDLLVNNAGVMFTPRGRTADGFETQLGTNHLGHFALTGLLLPALQAAPAARVVTVSSTAHRLGRLDLDDLNWERHRYDRLRAYARSKLANLLFALELDRRLTAAGSPVESLAAHPGVVRTNLGHGVRGPLGLAQSALLRVMGPVLIGPEAGALPQLRAATDRSLPGGCYVGPDGPGERSGSPVVVATSPEALDEHLAAALWDRSATLTDTHPDLPPATPPTAHP